MVVFTPDKALAEAINEPFAQFQSIELSDDVSEDLLARVGDEIPVPDDAPEVADVMQDEPQKVSDEAGPELITPPPFTKFAQVESSSPVPVHAADEDEPEPISEPEPEPNSESAAVSDPETAVVPPSPNSEPEPDIESEAQLEPEVKPESTSHPDGAQALYDSEDDSEPVSDEVNYTEDELNSVARKSLFKGFIWGALVSVLVCAVVFYVVYPKGVVEAPKSNEKEDASVAPDSVSASAASASDGAIPATSVAEKPAVVLDTLTAQMVLFRMARKHYGEAHFWVYIYQENRDKIKDPNNVNPGTVVVIPPAEKYGIDANSKESVDKAKALSYEILSRY